MTQRGAKNDKRSSLSAVLLGKEANVHTAEMRAAVESGEKLAIDPLSPKRCRWDVIIVLLTLYTCYALPLRVAFGDDKFGPLAAMSLLVDMLFLVDILINLNTGYELPTGGMELRLAKGRREYMRTWFIPDLVAALPIDLVMLLISEDSSHRIYLRVPRLLRLLRLPRLFRYIGRWEHLLPLSPVTLRIVKLAFMIVIFAHVDACAQFFAAQLEGFPEDSWVNRTDILEEDRMTQYVHALFMAFSHMLCIGYGTSGGPLTKVDLWVTMMSMLGGACFFVVLIGMISSTLMEDRHAREDDQRAQIAGKLNEISGAMHALALRAGMAPGTVPAQNSPARSRQNSDAPNDLVRRVAGDPASRARSGSATWLRRGNHLAGDASSPYLRRGSV